MDHGLKTWQAYGGPKSCLVRSTPRFAEQIVELYNDPQVRVSTCQEASSAEEHRAWLAREEQLGRDANFVILAKAGFAGTISLNDVIPDRTAEVQRFVTATNGLRPFALAAEFLVISYAFNVLHCRSVWCALGASAPQIVDFHLKNGWERCPHYDRPSKLDPSGKMLGLRFGRDQWAPAMEECRDLLIRLTGQAPEDWRVNDIPALLAAAS